MYCRAESAHFFLKKEKKNKKGGKEGSPSGQLKKHRIGGQKSGLGGKKCGNRQGMIEKSKMMGKNLAHRFSRTVI